MDWSILTLDMLMPGWVFMTGMLILHFITATAAHIKTKDFKISMWPDFLGKVTQFTISLLTVNLGILLSKSLESGASLVSLVGIVQAGLYALFFGYYADNIFKHLNMLGMPVDPGLAEFFKSLFGKVTGIGALASDQDNGTNDEGGNPV